MINWMNPNLKEDTYELIDKDYLVFPWFSLKT